MARVSKLSIALLFCFSALSGAEAAETLSSYSSQGSKYPDTIGTSSSVSVKCTSASGASSGSTARCHVKAPGFQGNVDVGSTIGTSGPGNVELTCSGNYPANGMLTCTAVVDAPACAGTQNLSAYSSGGSTYGDTAATLSPASVTCTRASGASSGSTARCRVTAPGFQGTVNVGQSIGTTGPGTVQLTCSGTYPVGGTLSCGARVVQSCP